MAGDRTFEAGDLLGKAQAVNTNGMVAPGEPTSIEADLAEQAAHIEGAFAGRLAAIVPYLVGLRGTSPPTRPDDSNGNGSGSGSTTAVNAGELLDTVARAICTHPAQDRLWLALSALACSLPSAEDVGEARYRAETSTPDRVAMWMLDYASARLTRATERYTLRVVSNLVFVVSALPEEAGALPDIDRVAQAVMTCWMGRSEVLRVDWAPGCGGWIALPVSAMPATTSLYSLPPFSPKEILIPWHTTVVALGIPPVETCESMAAAAQFSGSTFVAVVDDCFPAASAGLLPDATVTHVAKYLSALKHFKRLVATSEASAADYRGFTSALPAQGIAGPDVTVCPLPTVALPTVALPTVTQSKSNPCLPESASSEPATSESSSFEAFSLTKIPTVLCIGDLDDRANILGLLYASESLWNEGFNFEVTLVGVEFPSNDACEMVDLLVAAGRPVNLRLGVSESDVDSHYRSARFVVFASGHEGSSVAISESLSRRVPVVCSRFIIPQEVGGSAGIVTFDPGDEASLVAAMRTLLVDDAAIGELRAEIDGRASRAWHDYADDLWAMIVGSPPGPRDHPVGPDIPEAPDTPVAPAS